MYIKRKYKIKIKSPNSGQQSLYPQKKKSKRVLHRLRLLTFFFLSLKLIRFELVQGVQMTTRRKMCQIKGISEAKMEKIKVRCISKTT